MVVGLDLRLVVGLETRVLAVCAGWIVHCCGVGAVRRLVECVAQVDLVMGGGAVMKQQQPAVVLLCELICENCLNFYLIYFEDVVVEFDGF